MVMVQDRKITQSLRSNVNDANVEEVPELIAVAEPVSGKQRKDKEDELIITAIIFLGVALTALYVYVRYTTVSAVGKTL